MNVNKHGQIYSKEFVIDKTVQFETILYIRDSVCVDASFLFKQNYVTPFTVLYNVIVCKTAIVSENVIINSITQNYLIVHSIMHVICNQLLFETLS